MNTPAMDDVLGAESDLRHLNTLIDIITDMAIDGAALSPGASDSDRATIASLGSMMWVARDLCNRITKNLEDATARVMAEGAAKRMAGGERNG